VLADQPGETQVSHFLGRRFPLGYDARRSKIVASGIAALYQQAAVDAAKIEQLLAAGVRGQRPGAQDADTLLPGRTSCQQLERGLAIAWRDNALDEALRLRDLVGGRLVHLAVEGQHAAVGAERVAFIGFAESLLERRTHCGAARVV